MWTLLYKNECKNTKRVKNERAKFTNVSQQVKNPFALIIVGNCVYGNFFCQ